MRGNLGQYRFLRKLGAGGMGEVYLAQDTTLDRPVAIKLLPADVAADPERQRRFLREAKAASALSHPNVCVVHEVGETDDGQLYIVMEYVEGETLEARIGSRPVEIGPLLKCALQIVDAMEAAHAKGITHRDLKPANVMVTSRGQVKVLDFGLARVASPGNDALATVSNTAPGVVMGTVQYMSPEQALGREVDQRSDLFSLGVVLYQLGTSRLPFHGATATETIERIVHAQPDAMARFNYELPGELERIVRKCLEKDRERRYQSARELMVDLQNLQRDSDARGMRVAPANARGPGRVRQWAVAALAAAALAAAGVGLYSRLGGRSQTIDSVAVLPFANQNRDAETEYLSEGLAESIINNLTQLAELRVIARSSSFRYKGRDDDPFGAGRDLGVRAVLTGRVLQRGDTLTISAELVDVQENKQIWGQQYNRTLADVFAIQEEIARDVSESLRVRLTGAERQQLARRPTESLKAFQYYMQGRAHAQRRTREDLLMAVRYCQRAIDEDRGYALAYAGLSDATSALALLGHIPPAEGRRETEAAARQALALDDQLAEAHVALGVVNMMFTPSSFSVGDRELRRAIELSPSSALAHFYLGASLARQGRIDESLAEFLKARELDPLSAVIAKGVALSYYLKRDYPRSLTELRNVDDLGPTLSTTWEIGLYVQLRLFEETLAELEKAKLERKNDPILIYSTGMIYAAQAKPAEARQVIADLKSMSGADLSQALWIAKIHATLNERDETFDWLQRGLAAGAIGLFFKDDPVWDTIRSDRRFDDLVRRMIIAS